MNDAPEHEKPPRAKPVRMTALLYGAIFGLGILAVALVVLPVDWKGAKSRYRFWKAGARPVLWEKHRGFTRDRCHGKPASECACVWMIHGLGDSVTTWRRFFLDESAFGDLPVRIFAIDLPGHGGSLKRREMKDYRVSNMARELTVGISATPECKMNALIGNSFGGWVATRMVLDSPGRYSRLILISPTGTMASELATKDLLGVPTVENLKEFQRRAYAHPRELTQGEWASAVERLKDGAVSEVRRAQVPEDRLGGNLTQIRLGTFLIRGDADQIVSRDAIEVFARALPRHELVTLPECGHLPQKECPEKLFPEIRRALTMHF
jgi:pimeloyl-ACP methyl ester carboxylesterase